MTGVSDPSGMKVALIAGACLFSMVLLAVVVLWIFDKLFRRNPTPSEIEEHSRRFNERLLHPDFQAAEKHYGVPLPESLKKLYADKEEILRDNFVVDAEGADAPEDGWYVAYYQPVDAEALGDSWPNCEQYFAFADDGCGNGYLIKVGEADPEVLFHDHETGERTKVSDTLSVFLSTPRRTPSD